MSRLPSRVSEYVLIWLAILTGLVVAAYRLMVVFAEAPSLRSDAWAGLSVEDWITNALMLWSVTLLLAACFLWQAARKHHRELARIIASVSPDVLAVVTPDRRITLCNPAVKAMFGLDPAEVIGRTTDVFYADRRTTGDNREIYHSLEHHGFHMGFATGRRQNGETMPLEVVTGDLDGRKGAVILIRDITERKRAEAEIVKAKEALEEGYRRLTELESLRDNLTNMVVHDIKHAVCGVSASLEMLKRHLHADLTREAAGYLESAEGFTGDMLEMVRSLLDISRMESGQMPLNRAVCDLVDLAGEAAGVVRAVAAGKGVRVVLPVGPLTVSADADVIRRVFSNLLTNAVRFAPEASEVQVSVDSVDGVARVEIRDDGPGVPLEYQAKIFEKFGRVELQRHGSDHSTGLGLTFCKLAVETHGGRIGVVSPSPSSASGRGSTFWFTLPA